jgi:hypothetical protein
MKLVRERQEACREPEYGWRRQSLTNSESLSHSLLLRTPAPLRKVFLICTPETTLYHGSDKLNPCCVEIPSKPVNSFVMAAALRDFPVPEIGSKSETPWPQLQGVSVLEPPNHHERSLCVQYT